MPGEQLGQGLNNNISAIVDRPKPARRGKRIVHNQKQPMVFCKPGQPFDIRNTQCGVRDNLNQDHLCLGSDRGGHRLHIARIGEAGCDPQTRQILCHHAQGPTVKLIAADHMIAARQKTKQNRTDRGHTGPGDNAAVIAFQSIHMTRHHVGIGVAFTCIGIPLHAPLILRIQRIGRVACIHNRGGERRDNRPACTARQRHGADEGAFGVFHSRKTV